MTTSEVLDLAAYVVKNIEGLDKYANLAMSEKLAVMQTIGLTISNQISITAQLQVIAISIENLRAK